MLEAKKRKVEKEEEVSRLQKEVESLSSTLESLHAKAALLTSGMDEKTITEEQLRSESLMKELCSVRVSSLSSRDE